MNIKIVAHMMLSKFDAKMTRSLKKIQKESGEFKSWKNSYQIFLFFFLVRSQLLHFERTMIRLHVELQYQIQTDMTVKWGEGDPPNQGDKESTINHQEYNVV